MLTNSISWGSLSTSLAAILLLTACQANNSTNYVGSSQLPPAGNYSGTITPSVYLGPNSASNQVEVKITQLLNNTLQFSLSEALPSNPTQLVFSGQLYPPTRNSTCFSSMPTNALIVSGVTNGWAQSSQVGNIYLSNCTVNFNNGKTTFTANYYYTTTSNYPFPISGGISGSLSISSVS